MSRKELQIKICGMKDPFNLEAVCRLLPDFIGYIFYPRSKRFVGAKPDPALFTLPPEGIKKVGVFVNADIAEISQAFKSYGLDLVQLHGQETAGECKELKSRGIPILKALDPFLASGLVERYRDCVDLLLFDTPDPAHGGTGRKFDWTVLEPLRLDLPFLIGGGVGPEDAKSLKEMSQPALAGVDVNSRFEEAPGLKKVALLEEFIQQIRKKDL